MKFDIQSLLKDKNVLYVTLFIAITNMFAYLMFRQFDAVIFFVIVSVIASHFSKNMIIILLAAILSTNFAVSVKVIGKVKEGMTNRDDDNKAVPKQEDTKKKNTLNTPKPVEGKDKNSKKQGFTQQLNPARINAADGDDDEDYDSQPTIDYASTLESAYDNLDKLLSSDAINNMSEDTHRLAEKQQLLMGNINKLQPMMEKAGSLLEGLNMEKMTNMLDGLGSKLTSLTGTGAGAGSDMNAMGPVGASEKKNTKKAQ
jgi:hypothetical protein